MVRLTALWYAFTLLLSLFFILSPVSAAEINPNELPAPETVAGLDGPIVIAFPEPFLRPEPIFSTLGKELQSLSPFWADFNVNMNVRSYYFQRDNLKFGPLAIENEAWAIGNMLQLESGKLWDTVSFGSEWFLSAPVSASDNTPGSGLLKPIQQTISTLGQNYIRAEFGQKFTQKIVTLGRQRINKPYLNSNDSRMLPNTFQGITLDGHWQHGRYFMGYIDKIKTRNNDEVIAMGRRVGVKNSDEGLVEMGGRFDWGNNNFIGVISSYIPDILSTTYSELDMRWDKDDWGFRFGTQYTDQRSVGKNLLTGSSFNTQSLGLRLSASINSLILTSVITHNGSDANIRAPFGSDPSFSTLMLSNFNLANQTTYRVGLSYTGTRWGYPGVSGFLNYAKGVNARNSVTGKDLPSNEEIDYTMDFKPKMGLFSGLWLRVRYGIINPGTNRERDNVRMILNWQFQFL